LQQLNLTNIKNGSYYCFMLSDLFRSSTDYKDRAKKTQ